MEEKKPTSIFNLQFLSIFVVFACVNISSSILNSTLPKYAKFLGATATVIGMISSAFTVTSLILRPVTGPALDSFDKKKLLLLGMGITALGNLCCSFVTTIPILTACRLIMGAGVGVVYPLCMTIATNSVPEDKITSGLGIFSLGTSISTAIAPSMALYVIGAFGYEWSFRMAAALNVIAMIICCLVKIPDNTHRPFKVHLKNMVAVEAIKPSAMIMLTSMVHTSINTYLIICAESRGVDGIGLYFTVYAVCLFAVRPLSGIAADKFGRKAVIIPCIFLYAASMITISFANNLAGFLVAAVLIAVGYGGAHPAMQAMVMSSVPKERRGVASSTNYIGVDLGYLFGPLVFGAIVDSFNYAVMYRCTTIFLALVLVIMFVVPDIKAKKAA